MWRGRAPPETDTTGRKNTAGKKKQTSFRQFPGHRSLRYVSPCLNVALHISGQHHCLTSHVLTWNFPAFVTYLTPLNGLYFSPYMSKRFTFKPVSKRTWKERNKLQSWSHQPIQYLLKKQSLRYSKSDISQHPFQDLEAMFLLAFTDSSTRRV